MNYKIQAIPAEIAAEVRRSMVSPQYESLAAFASVADGYGPCRSCLRVFDQGEENRIYFTYNAFDGLSSLPDPGPVYIHEHECAPFGEGFPADLLSLPIFLEAFADEGRTVERRRMDRENVHEQIAGLLSSEGVKFVNLRNAEAGCYIARAVGV